MSSDHGKAGDSTAGPRPMRKRGLRRASSEEPQSAHANDNPDLDLNSTGQPPPYEMANHQEEITLNQMDSQDPESRFTTGERTFQPASGIHSSRGFDRAPQHTFASNFNFGGNSGFSCSFGFRYAVLAIIALGIWTLGSVFKGHLQGS